MLCPSGYTSIILKQKGPIKILVLFAEIEKLIQNSYKILRDPE
jgi:hypothetical protein